MAPSPAVEVVIGLSSSTGGFDISSGQCLNSSMLPAMHNQKPCSSVADTKAANINSGWLSSTGQSHIPCVATTQSQAPSSTACLFSPSASSSICTPLLSTCIPSVVLHTSDSTNSTPIQLMGDATCVNSNFSLEYRRARKEMATEEFVRSQAHRGDLARPSLKKQDTLIPSDETPSEGAATPVNVSEHTETSSVSGTTGKGMEESEVKPIPSTSSGNRSSVQEDSVFLMEDPGSSWDSRCLSDRLDSVFSSEEEKLSGLNSVPTVSSSEGEPASDDFDSDSSHSSVLGMSSTDCDLGDSLDSTHPDVLKSKSLDVDARGHELPAMLGDSEESATVFKNDMNVSPRKTLQTMASIDSGTLVFQTAPSTPDTPLAPTSPVYPRKATRSTLQKLEEQDSVKSSFDDDKPSSTKSRGKFTRQESVYADCQETPISDETQNQTNTPRKRKPSPRKGKSAPDVLDAHCSSKVDPLVADILSKVHQKHSSSPNIIDSEKDVYQDIVIPSDAKPARNKRQKIFTQSRRHSVNTFIAPFLRAIAPFRHRHRRHTHASASPTKEQQIFSDVESPEKLKVADKRESFRRVATAPLLQIGDFKKITEESKARKLSADVIGQKKSTAKKMFRDSPQTSKSSSNAEEIVVGKSRRKVSSQSLVEEGEVGRFISLKTRIECETRQGTSSDEAGPVRSALKASKADEELFLCFEKQISVSSEPGMGAEKLEAGYLEGIQRSMASTLRTSPKTLQRRFKDTTKALGSSTLSLSLATASRPGTSPKHTEKSPRKFKLPRRSSRSKFRQDSSAKPVASHAKRPRSGTISVPVQAGTSDKNGKPSYKRSFSDFQADLLRLDMKEENIHKDVMVDKESLQLNSVLSKDFKLSAPEIRVPEETNPPSNTIERQVSAPEQPSPLPHVSSAPEKLNLIGKQNDVADPPEVPKGSPRRVSYSGMESGRRELLTLIPPGYPGGLSHGYTLGAPFLPSPITPHSPVPYLCSHCMAALPLHSAPLAMALREGTTAHCAHSATLCRLRAPTMKSYFSPLAPSPRLPWLHPVNIPSACLAGY